MCVTRMYRAPRCSKDIRASQYVRRGVPDVGDLTFEIVSRQTDGTGTSTVAVGPIPATGAADHLARHVGGVGSVLGRELCAPNPRTGPRTGRSGRTPGRGSPTLLRQPSFCAPRGADDGLVLA